MLIDINIGFWMILDDDVGNVLVQRNGYRVSHVTYAHRRETALLRNSFVWLQSVVLTCFDDV